MHTSTPRFASGLLLALVVTACSGGEEPPPPPPPTQVQLTVVDAVDDGPLAGAFVYVAGSAGWTEVSADGVVTLEVDPGTHAYWVVAPMHVTVPPPLTDAPTVEAAANQTTEVRVVVDRRSVGAADGTIRGTVTVDGTPAEGVLVVAAGVPSYEGYSDATGAYVIAGVGNGSFQVRARQGGTAGDASQNVTTTAGQTSDGVDFALVSGGQDVTGTIAGGTGSGRVALLDPDVRRVVPGLSVSADLASGYTITGVPAGRYRLLGAFDADAYVMDPEPIRENGLPVVDVDAAAVTQDFGVAPAIDGLAPTGTATATPELSWAPFAGADYYVVDFRDAAGRTIWGGFDATGNWSTRTFDTSVMYGGPALSPGARYTFRVFAAVQDPIVPSVFALVAASEAEGASFRVAR
ncbi:MAG: carboxypeptidase-like regulatory domain-containing protein [Deltaproteobacteria bacterium]